MVAGSIPAPGSVKSRRNPNNEASNYHAYNAMSKRLYGFRNKKCTEVPDSDFGGSVI